jgi:hypothetical protein
MKLRIMGDSIRLRLARSEVRALEQGGRVAQSTRFPGGESFTYELVSSPAAADASARFQASRLTVTLPRDTAMSWCRSETVGIRAAPSLQTGELSLLIEKDFPCLTPRAGEDESDRFSRPAGQADECGTAD